MQVHRNGDVIQWFSRKGIDHGVQSDYNILNPLVKERLKSTKCVLDGELLIWNTARWAARFSNARVVPLWWKKA
jgi:ATP-dependent DNA ligase